jgi:hypothetical protein
MGPSLWKFRFAALVTAALLAIAGRAAASNFIQVKDEEQIIPAIGECLSQNEEAVLLSDGVQCAGYRKGSDILQNKARDAPFDFNPDKDCMKEASRPVNARL